MKIIITVNSYYPLKDGVQFVTQYHAENLARKGHDVLVFTVNHGFKKEEIYNNVKIVRFNVKTKHTIYKGEKKLFRNKVLEATKDADAIINVCTQNPLTDWCFKLLNNIKCKKILYMHGMYNTKFDFNTISSFKDIGHKLWNNSRWGSYYIINKKYFKKYDRVIQLHEFDYGYKFFKNKFKINGCIIENAVDSRFFDGQVKKEPIIISVANYKEGKNQEFILNAFYKSSINDRYKLILIGSQKTKYYERLLKIKNKLETKYGKRQVYLLYGVNRDDTINYIKKSSLYLLGSKAEVYPVSISEAMASKIPYISTNVGVVRYLPGGVIVNTEDEMTYWINILANNPKLSEYYGMSGYEYAKENMMIEKKVNDLEKILKEAET